MTIINTKFSQLAALSGLLAILVATPAWSEIAVIVHPSIYETASASDISRIFLGKSKHLPGGTKVIPVNLERGNVIRKEFNDKALGKSDPQLLSYWSRLVFTGKAQPPRDAGSEIDVLELVKNNPNTIGYISAAQVTTGVKVIATF